MSVGAGVVGMALVLDAVLAEPPRRLHPVAWVGRAVGAVDRPWATPRLVGAVAAVLLPLGVGAVTAGFVTAAEGQFRVAGAALAALVLFTTTSFRRLLATALAVCAESDRDLAAARTDLQALAGRDADALSAGQVRSAAVESAAENLADGLVAPLLAFVLVAPLSLAAAAGAAAWVKTVNTMDSMLGYRSKPVGWAPARLDDLVMWLPARVSAVLLALAALAPAAPLRAARWVGDVPSPNSGWPMGTLAAALDVRLAKPGAYTLAPDAALPSPSAATSGVRVVAVAGLLAYGFAAGSLLFPVVVGL